MQPENLSEDRVSRGHGTFAFLCDRIFSSQLRILAFQVEAFIVMSTARRLCYILAAAEQLA